MVGGDLCGRWTVSSDVYVSVSAWMWNLVEFSTQNPNHHLTLTSSNLWKWLFADLTRFLVNYANLLQSQCFYINIFACITGTYSVWHWWRLYLLSARGEIGSLPSLRWSQTPQPPPNSKAHSTWAGSAVLRECLHLLHSHHPEKGWRRETLVYSDGGGICVEEEGLTLNIQD